MWRSARFYPAGVEDGGKEDKVMMSNDVARAFFEAGATRSICIGLPDEDKNEEDWNNDNVGLLRKNFCGTIDAAVKWQEEVARY